MRGVVGSLLKEKMPPVRFRALEKSWKVIRSRPDDLSTIGIVDTIYRIVWVEGKMVQSRREGGPRSGAHGLMLDKQLQGHSISRRFQSNGLCSTSGSMVYLSSKYIGPIINRKLDLRSRRRDVSAVAVQLGSPFSSYTADW
jgi:hypothetical protein